MFKKDLFKVKKSFSFRRVLSAGVVGLTLTLTFPIVTQATPAKGNQIVSKTSGVACELTPERFSVALQNLSGPNRASWIASDGFTSMPLPDNKTLFVNSDTFWGTSDGIQTMLSGKMINNSLIVYDPANPNCFTALSGPRGESFFPPISTVRKTAHWVWPSTAVNDGNGNISLILSGVEVKPFATTMWDFNQFGSEIRNYKWDGSTLVEVGKRRTLSPVSAEPPNGVFQWVGTMVHEGWVYFTPTHLRQGQWGHDLYLARVPQQTFFNTNGADIRPQLEFKTKTGWKKGAVYSELDPVAWGTGGAIASLSKGLNEIHIVLKEFSMLGNKVVDYHAPTFDGPFVRTELFTVPTTPNTFSYWANVHKLSTTKGLSRKVTINYNNAENLGWGILRVMDRYRPRLYDTVLPEMVKIRTGNPNSSAIVNLTATGGNSSGFLTAQECSPKTLPQTSNVNFTQLGTKANSAVVRTDANGDFCVVPSTGTHIVVDHVGSVPAGELLSTPERILDTRVNNPNVGVGGTLKGGETIMLQTPAKPGTVVLGNLTVTGAADSGFITTHSCATQTPPKTSVNNFVANQTVANYVATKSDPSGKICIYASSDVHIVFDYTGTNTTFSPTPPRRKLDTRTASSVTGGNKVAGGSVVKFSTGLPEGYLTVGNLTVTGGEGTGYATVFPCGSPIPQTSSVNFGALTNTPNFAVSRVGTNGEVCIYVHTTAHVIYDENATANVPTFASSPKRVIDTRAE